jgi:hypothetical protein
MPFVKRDAAGCIVALFRERSDEAPEYLAANSSEIAEFSDPEGGRGERTNMLQSDLEMIQFQV